MRQQRKTIQQQGSTDPVVVGARMDHSVEWQDVRADRAQKDPYVDSYVLGQAPDS